MRPVFFMLLLAGFSLSSCNFIRGKKVRGDGHVIADNRHVETFSKLEQKGSFDILVRTGPLNVLVEAEENIARKIVTYVENDKLVVRTEEGYWLKPTKDIKIVITAPRFSEIWSNGSGNITSENLISDSSEISVGTRGSGNITLQIQSPEINAKSHGSGNIELSGDSRTVSLESAGSGNLTAEGLRAESVSVDIMGSGNASVNASKSLDISVKGSGDVSYKGNPAIKTDIKGSGNVNKID